MATIQQYYDYSLLALGAYAIGLSAGPLNGASNSASLIRADMTQPQIDSFAATGWLVVSQSEDAIYGDGFSATLFQNMQTGEYVFANRGTVEFSADLVEADVWGIAIMGTAGGQVVDMVRYYKRLITPEGQSVSYTQDQLERMYSVANWYQPGGYASITDLANALAGDTGLGKLAPTEKVTVDGHSLGGHLALWFKTFFDSSVNSVYTFNGAGLGGAISSAGTAVVGVFGNITSAISDSRVLNIYGDGGPNIIAGVGGSVGANIGARIEAKGAIDSLAANLYNHSIVTLSDALSVPALIQKLEPTLTLDRTNTLLDAASNKIDSTQEAALDAVRRLFGLKTATSEDNRADFHAALKQLSDSTAFKSLAGKVTVELATAADLAASARTDFSTFLSLQNLSPIILKTDATGQAILKQANEPLAQQWEADQSLTPEQRDAGLENFTSTYLLDRQALLQYRIVANIKDAVANPDGYLAIQGTRPTENNLRFIDIGSTTMLQVDTSRPSPSTAPNQYVIFGNDSANTINGSAQGDRLYGGDGNDGVNGSDGEDYLEGNAGNDAMDGGKGIDTLLGGAGDDTLTGGEASDFLFGGAGNDTYYFEGNVGIDIVQDGDGVGKIVVGAPGFEALSGGKKLAENVWISDDKMFTYKELFTCAA